MVVAVQLSATAVAAAADVAVLSTTFVQSVVRSYIVSLWRGKKQRNLQSSDEARRWVVGEGEARKGPLAAEEFAETLRLLARLPPGGENWVRMTGEYVRRRASVRLLEHVFRESPHTFSRTRCRKQYTPRRRSNGGAAKSRRRRDRQAGSTQPEARKAHSSVTSDTSAPPRKTSDSVLLHSLGIILQGRVVTRPAPQRNTDPSVAASTPPAARQDRHCARPRPRRWAAARGVGWRLKSQARRRVISTVTNVAAAQARTVRPPAPGRIPRKWGPGGGGGCPATAPTIRLPPHPPGPRAKQRAPLVRCQGMG